MRTPASARSRAARSRARRSRPGAPRARVYVRRRLARNALPFRALGVWRSLVARSVRVGEVPSSNLGTPICRRGNPVVPPPGSPPSAQGTGPRVRASRPACRPPAATPGARQRHRVSDGAGRAVGPYPRLDAARRSARRRLHALPARAGARAGGVPARGATARARARSRPLRGRAARCRRRPAARTRSSSTTRRSGSRSPEDIVRGMGGDGRRLARVRDRASCASGSGTRTSSSTTTRCRRSTHCARTACASASSPTGSATWTSSPSTTSSTSTSASARMRHGCVEAAPVDLRGGARRRST